MKKISLVLLFAILIFVIGCAANEPIEKPQQNPQKQAIPNQEIPEEPQNAPPSPKSITPPNPEEEKISAEQQPKTPLWKEGSAAIAGKYADADIIALDNGRYRMYYSAEPEVPGFKGQVYSALSSDGKSWAQEDGTRKEWAIFPSVIKLPDGKYRMYFQNQGTIKSAVSSDGLSWKDESGTRIDVSNNAGLTLYSVLAPTVIKSGNEYIMVYAGAINEEYPEKVPNKDMHLFLWATSTDGLNFEKKGIALDSRNDKFKGWLDGAELVQWGNGSLRLYFWGYKGIYYTEFNNGKFSQEPVFDFATVADANIMFPQNPPSDPTLAKINGKWFMYYGQHTKGIYYAVLE